MANRRQKPKTSIPGFVCVNKTNGVVEFSHPFSTSILAIPTLPEDMQNIRIDGTYDLHVDIGNMRFRSTMTALPELVALEQQGEPIPDNVLDAARAELTRIEERSEKIRPVQLMAAKNG
jgi:hypothetical protein